MNGRKCLFEHFKICEEKLKLPHDSKGRFKNPEQYVAQPQIGEPTFTHKFTGDDEIIDWKKTPQQIHNQIRALGCGRTKINGIDVKILETKIENNELKIIKIQPSGKNPMDWRSFVNGLHGAEIRYGE